MQILMKNRTNFKYATTIMDSIDLKDLRSKNKNGRTWRRRRKRRCSASLSYSVDSCPVLINLTQWLQSRYGRPSSPKTILKAAVFASTGRGLMTVRGLKAGEVVVSIPQKALVTCDSVFKDERMGKALQACSNKLKAMEVLTVFLIYQRYLGEASDWKPYIDSLPTKYTVPSFCSKEEISVMPDFLKGHILKQEEDDLRRCLENTREILRNLCNIDGLDFSPSLHDIRWGWFTVNTRAVYLKNPDPHPLLVDEDVYALAPYLDLLNHTHTAQVGTGLNEKHGCYEINTLVPYSAHEQVFINYGPHDNIKLYKEYGFILSNNPHSSVPLGLEDILDVMRNIEVEEQRKAVIYEKQQVILSQGFDKKLCISLEGPSWNLEVLLTIFLMTSEELRHWQVIYQDPYSVVHRQLVLQCLGVICRDKLANYRKTLCNMENIGECTEAFAFGKELVKECCDILINADVS